MLADGDPSRQTILFADIARRGRNFNAQHNVLLDIMNPNRLGSANVLDSNGSTSWNFLVPATLAGVSVYFQAAINGIKTNRLLVNIQ